VSLLSTTLVYSGNVAETATTRLSGHMLLLCRLFALVLVWDWASKRSSGIKHTLIGLGMAASVAGISMFALQVASAQTPQYSYFLTDLDARMYGQYWNQLEPDALVFDLTPYRAPTVFGRFTDAGSTWDSYTSTEHWQELIASPDPYSLRAAGFDYIYYDQGDWLNYSDPLKELMESPCAKVVERMEDGTNLRVLLNIQACTSP
jgi:hypothetical protein